MYHIICIFIGRLLVLAGKIVKRGSSLPGVILLKLDKKLLSFFKLPNKVIAVTGSSGKGSISSVIASIYENQGYRVAHNKAGSNLTPGILTLLLEHTNWRGKIKGDVLICEVDERYTKFVFPYIKPQYVVISNISRDQPPRQGHFDLVYEEIKKAITPDMHLILNGDDPYLRKFTFKTKNPITYYGISKNKYSYQSNKFENLNLSYCPRCNGKLKYNYYNFENTGDYYCSKCDFKTPKIDYQVTSIEYAKSNIVINEQYKMHIPFHMLYVIYNTTAAFTCAAVTGLDLTKTATTISQIHQNSKMYHTETYNDRIVTTMNNKNENSSTFNQSLLYVSRFKEPKTIVIGWKEISRRYRFDDLSWLYDIDFELLAKANIDKIVCVGIHCYDIATRLKYAGIPEKNIVTFNNLQESVSYVKQKTKGNIYAILNFDYVIPFQTYMKEDDNK